MKVLANCIDQIIDLSEQGTNFLKLMYMSLVSLKRHIETLILEWPILSLEVVVRTIVVEVNVMGI